MGAGSFPGVKRPGCGADHPSPSSAEVKERVELYLYSPSDFRGLLWGEIYLYLYIYIYIYMCVCVYVRVCARMCVRIG